MAFFDAISQTQALITGFQVSPYLNSGNNTSSGNNSTGQLIPNPCYTLQQEVLSLLDTLSTNFIGLVQNVATILLSPINCVSTAISGIESNANNALGTDANANPFQAFTNSVYQGIGDLYQGNNSTLQNIQNMSNNLTQNTFCLELGNIQNEINNLLNDIQGALSAINSVQSLLADVVNAISDITSAINCIKSTVSPNFLQALKDNNINSPKAAVFEQVNQMKAQMMEPGAMMQQSFTSIGQNLSVANNMQTYANAFSSLSI